MNRRRFLAALLPTVALPAFARGAERTPPVQYPTVPVERTPPFPVRPVEPTIPRTTITYRQHVGSHTHTCPVCGKAWDHSMDGNTHRCPWCKKGTQVVWDNPARLIEVHTIALEERVPVGHRFVELTPASSWSGKPVLFRDNCPPGVG